MTEPRLATALIRLNADLRAIEARWALIGGLAVPRGPSRGRLAILT